MVHINDPLYQTFLKVIAKHKKSNLISRQDYVKGSDSAGNSLAIGSPGYCKTSGNKREVELRYSLNHKIFCLYDGGERLDMAYFMFPSVSDFWKVPKLRTLRNSRQVVVAKRKYPTEVLIPISKDIPKKLPNCFVPFTIAVNSLTSEDLVALVGDRYKDNIIAAYSYMNELVDDTTTPLDYIRFLEQGWKRGDSEGTKLSFSGPKKLIESFFKPLLYQGLLTSGKLSTVIDIKEKIKDRKNISVLCLRHIPKIFHGFIVHYFINHIYNELSGIATTHMMKAKVTITLNEVADLLSKDSEQGTSAWSTGNMISKIAKQFRTASLYLLLDTQLPGELPEVKDTMKRIYVYNSSISSVEKAMTVAGISSYAGDINNDDFAIIPRLAPGYYYLFDRDAGVSIHKLMYCRSRTYIAGEDFYDIYDKVYGKTAYQNIQPLIDEVNNEKKISEMIWEERKKFNIPTQTKKRRRKNEETEDEDEERVEEAEEKKEEEKILKKDVKVNIEIKKIDEENKEPIIDPYVLELEAFARATGMKRPKDRRKK